MPTLTAFMQHSFGSSQHSNQRRKRYKRNPSKEVKLSLLTNNLMIYIENPKNATRKLLELINEFSKITGHKINMQKSVAFLYTNNEISEREVKETIPINYCIKNNKIPRNGGLVCCSLCSHRVRHAWETELNWNLPKEAKDKYSKKLKDVDERNCRQQKEI